MYKEYKYGAFKEKIKLLLRQRLSLKNKITYHKKMIVDLKKQLKEVEKETNKYLKLAQNTSKTILK